MDKYTFENICIYIDSNQFQRCSHLYISFGKFPKGTAAFVAPERLCLYILIIISARFGSRSASPSSVFTSSRAPNDGCVDQDNGVFMQNPKGCRFFYYCHNGQSLEANCPGTLWFDLETGICDKPEVVDCKLDDLPPQPTKPTPSPSPIATEPVHCPSRDSPEITFLGSRIDCGRYYICYLGKPRRQQCISDLHWNAAISRCDYPKNAKCPVSLVRSW